MKRRLVVSYLVLVAAALVLFTVPVALSSSALLERTLEQTSRREADLFVPLVLRDDAAAAQAIRDRTRDFENATGSRVRLVRADAPTDDPQVAAALDGSRPAARWGRHPLLGADAVSVVVPVRQDGRIVAAVQVVAPAADVRAEIRGIWRFRLATGGVVLLLAAALAVVLSSSLSRPLRRLESVASRHGQGDFAARAEEAGPAEVAALARTLNASARRTQVLIDSQRAFVADASHQLRTPLTALRLTLDNLRATSGDPQTARRIDTLEEETRRMGRIVEGLLDLARAEARTDRAGEVPLEPLVRGRLEVWAAAFEDADVDVRPRFSGAPVAVAAEGALEQALDNVLDNALLAAPPGSVIDLVASAGPGHVELVVRDRGPGLSAEQLRRACDRFWTTRPGVGSGLGLTVVRELVEHDGGSVELRRPDDGEGGLAVVLRLPRAARRASRH